MRSDGVSKDAEVATFTSKAVEPVRLTAQATLWGIETTARIRGFEEALRADIRAVMGDQLDCTGVERTSRWRTMYRRVIEGIIAQLADPENPTVAATWDDYLSLYPARVDGKTSMDGLKCAAYW